MGGNWGGDGKLACIAHRIWVAEGCSGTWLREMGEKWDKNGTKIGHNTHFSQFHFPKIFRRSKIFPTTPFVEVSSPHSPTENFLPLTDTHHHGPE